MSIETDAFVVFGKDTCPYCTKAISLAKGEGYPVAYMDLIEYPNLRDPSWETVPQVFYKGAHIGGYTDLVAYFEGLSGHG